MSMGRPIITTNAPGCRETINFCDKISFNKKSKEVIAGLNGFLVPPKKVTALVRTMEWFVDHPFSIHEMGRHSRQYAQSKYDIHRVNELILQAMGL
jgi:glycosyltransferase involved in cell wall biosynthesis